MLDDAEKIAAIDKSGALKVAAEQHKQLLLKIDPPAGGWNLKIENNISNVVLTGMGGSALAGLIVRNWWDSRLKIPFIVTRNYELPAFVGPDTLVIASSYSGNTEETLSAAQDAAKKGAKLVALTSGGQLAEKAKAHNHPLLEMPPGLQPRMAVWYAVRLLAELFEQLELVSGAVTELTEASDFLAKQAASYAPEVPTNSNQAKQIAGRLQNKSVIIYAGPILATAAYKWKISFNESAKNLAWSNEFPELNHNEFIGWSGAPDNKPFAVVELKSNLDSAQIQKRFDVSNRLLVEKMPKPIEVEAQGQSHIEQLLWTIQLGDFASNYLAILNNIDPTPVDLIEKLKKELA